jgi:Protein of unknown function (DUF2490)
MRSVMVFCWLFLPALAGAQDFQQWNEVDFTASWRNADVLVPVLARTDTHLPNPQLAATGITVDMPLRWHLTLTGGYLFADLPQRTDDVHLPLIAVSATFHIRRLTLADRNRFEKLIGYGDSPVRYRNRILLDWPLGARNRWHLFTDNEVFFNLTAGRWNQNRFQAGGGARLNRRLFLDVYYLQRAPSGGAAKTNVLGTTLKVRITPRKEEVPGHERND